MTIRTALLQRRAAICVHGIGYIGYSAAAHFAARGIEVYGVDPDIGKARAASRGVCPVPGLDVWLRAAGIDLRPIRSVTSLSLLAQTGHSPIAVHHVAVPTEAEGAPANTALYDACAAIAASDPAAIVVIESTVVPLYLDEIQRLHPGLRLVSAPRRDWFDSPDKSLRSLPRIVGADDPVLLDAVCGYLSLVCDVIVRAPSLREAALVKVIENAIRQIELAFGNELALALGERYDVRELLRLAATKWNILSMFPSIGIGGYCLPLAPQYLDTLGAPTNLARLAYGTSMAHVDRVAGLLSGYRCVTFLGVGYKANTPYTPSGAATWLAKKLTKAGIEVCAFACGPGESEAIRALGLIELRWPDNFGQQGGALVLPTPNAQAREIHEAMIREASVPYEMVLDNEGVLGHLPASLWTQVGTDYRQPGRKGWLR